MWFGGDDCLGWTAVEFSSSIGPIFARPACGRMRLGYGHSDCDDVGPPAWPARAVAFGFLWPGGCIRRSLRNRLYSPEGSDRAGPVERGGYRIGGGGVLRSIFRRTRLCRHGKTPPVGVAVRTLLRSHRSGLSDTISPLLNR